MNLARNAVAVAAGLAALLASFSASAEPMDPAFERFRIEDACGPLGGPERCTADSLAFKRIVSQYAFAIAPTAMHTARTTGLGGFHLSMEATYAKIDDGADYWKKGTQGVVDRNSNNPPSSNGSPASILQTYSLKFAKSFGFGLELSSQLGFMPQTSIVVGGADVRISLLEGFRKDLPGILPDLAVGGAVRTITGTPQMQLTVAGVDTQISKPLVLGDASVLSPFVGYQYLWIFGDSGLIDLTPTRDAVQYCGFAGPNVPGNPDPGKSGQFDGQPVCKTGNSQDFNNNIVFQKARLERQRLIFGLSWRYEMVTLGGAFITDIVDPADAQAGDEKTIDRRAPGNPQRSDSEVLAGTPRQWTMVIQLGTMF